jgi:hypothetical protein
MRQCRESIAYLRTLKNPVYDIEIKGEQDILNHFMKNIEVSSGDRIERKAA